MGWWQTLEACDLGLLDAHFMHSSRTWKYGAKGLVTATFVQRRNRSRNFLNFCLRLLYNQTPLHWGQLAGNSVSGWFSYPAFTVISLVKLRILGLYRWTAESWRTKFYNFVSFDANKKGSQRFNQLVERSNLTRGIRNPGKFDLSNSFAQK